MANQTFTKIILGRMHEVLKPRGFRKNGTTFTAEPEDVLQLVHLRKSWTSTRDEVNGFVLVGLHSRYLQQNGIGYAPPGANPSFMEECHLHTDLGHLTPAQHGVWLTIKSEEQAELVGREIAEALTEYALPKLDALSSTLKLRGYLEQTSPEELVTVWSLANRDHFLRPLRGV